jgi:5-methylcytosine-specific restriction endonuclease McrBC regulatory subunit McrC
LIIDTKYKKLDKLKANNWVSSSDIYQMFAYWMRYFWEYNIEMKKNIILLYPDYDWINYNISHLSEENINIFIKTINLNFDLSSNEWKKKLIESLILLLKPI